jgi:hypothetical protein
MAGTPSGTSSGADKVLFHLRSDPFWTPKWVVLTPKMGHFGVFGGLRDLRSRDLDPQIPGFGPSEPLK